jgi:Icc-related predicted phosphoesterase
MKTVKICAIADLHSNLALKMPPADILTVSGDLTYRGSLLELSNVRHWLREQPAKYKVVIAGNHDFGLEDWRTRSEAESYLAGDNIYYLRDNSVTLEGLKIYGSPWQPWFYDWAFNLQRGPEIAEKWAMIPDDVDVLLTHGPPYGYGDQVKRGRVGCEDLLAAIDKKKPRVVCYGHIHEDPGTWHRNGTTLINCSVGYGVYHGMPQNNPTVFELETK